MVMGVHMDNRGFPIDSSDMLTIPSVLQLSYTCGFIVYIQTGHDFELAYIELREVDPHEHKCGEEKKGILNVVLPAHVTDLCDSRASEPWQTRTTNMPPNICEPHHRQSAF